jgi:hypothetical protein
VRLAHRTGSERPAAVGSAPAVALVLHAGPVVDQPAGPAVDATGAELRVERVQHLAAHAADRQITEQRNDVRPDQALVTGGYLNVDDLEVALHQLSHRRDGPRLTITIDVSEQSRANLLGLGRGSRPCRHGLCEVVPPPGDRVEA